MIVDKSNRNWALPNQLEEGDAIHASPSLPVGAMNRSSARVRIGKDCRDCFIRYKAPKHENILGIVKTIVLT